VIGFIRGTIIGGYRQGKKNQFLIVWPHETLEPAGVGYAILVTSQTAAKFPLAAKAEFWVYSVSTEKESFLVGLENTEKLNIFTKLLDVSGVGPKSALQIIDTLGVETFLHALAEKDAKLLSSVPGLGAKTAGKIILEIGDEFAGTIDTKSASQLSLPDYKLSLIKNTLQNLGYTQKESKYLMEIAADDLKTKSAETDDIGELIKVVLKHAAKA
jgi:Holliday junction DNA helicase RuvA